MRRAVLHAFVVGFLVGCGGNVRSAGRLSDGGAAGTAGSEQAGAFATAGRDNGVSTSQGGATNVGTTTGAGGGRAGSGAGGTTSAVVNSRCTRRDFDEGYPCDSPPTIRYAYDERTASCERVTHQGCGGNFGGTFMSEFTCRAGCQPELPPSDCPLHAMTTVGCVLEDPSDYCVYDGMSACLCRAWDELMCTELDARCYAEQKHSGVQVPPCTGDSCPTTSRIVLMPPTTCSCVGDDWVCQTDY